MAATPDTGYGDSPAARRLIAEHSTVRALVDAASFSEAAPKILQAICEALGWQHGALWTIDREVEALRCNEIWNAPGSHFPEFDGISRRITLARGIGLPGRVWSSGGPVWIKDVVLDTNFPRAQIAAQEGLMRRLDFRCCCTAKC